MSPRAETMVGICATTMGLASFAVLFAPPWLLRLAAVIAG